MIPESILLCKTNDTKCHFDHGKTTHGWVTKGNDIGIPLRLRQWDSSRIPLLPDCRPSIRSSAKKAPDTAKSFQFPGSAVERIVEPKLRTVRILGLGVATISLQPPPKSCRGGLIRLVQKATNVFRTIPRMIECLPTLFKKYPKNSATTVN